MTGTATSELAVALFADPGSEIWGMVVGGEHPHLALSPLDASGPGNPEGVKATSATVALDLEDDDVWSVSGDGIELELEFADARTQTPARETALRLCRLTGAAKVSGTTREIDIPGVLLPDLPTGQTDSIRMLGSWFPAGHEISLISVRPSGAKGQDQDVMNVAARGEEKELIFDPRLSTTYGPDGAPRTAGVELWLGNDDDDEQYPRRVSAVATGATATAAVGGFRIEAHALHCLSRGEEGSGVYVLMRAGA